MKKLFIIAVMILLLSGCEENDFVTPELEMRLNGSIVEYKYQNEEEWTILTDLSSMTEEKNVVFDFYVNDLGETVLVYGDAEVNIGIREQVTVREILFDKNTNQFIATYSDGTNSLIGTIDLPNVIDGSDGVGITSMDITENGHLVVQLSNGTINDLGNVHGMNGLNGQDGLSIIDIKIDDIGDCYITYSDFSKVNVGTIIGENGQDGQTGDKGETAYEIYKKYHPTYTKSEQEWVDDLVQGKLSSAESYDVLTEEDLRTAIERDDTKNIKLQNNIVSTNPLIITHEKNIDLNGYQINGHLKIESVENINVEIRNGKLVGDMDINLPLSIPTIEVEIEGNLKIYEINHQLILDYPISKGVEIFTEGFYSFNKNYIYEINIFTSDLVDVEGDFSSVVFQQDGNLSLNNQTTIDNLLVYDEYNISLFVAYGSKILELPSIGNLTIKEEVLLTVEGIHEGELTITQNEKEILPLIKNQYLLLKDMEFELYLYNENQFIQRENKILLEDETYYVSYIENTGYDDLLIIDDERIVSIEGTLVSTYLDMYILQHLEGVFFVPKSEARSFTIGNKYSLQGTSITIEGIPCIQTLNEQYEITRSVYQSSEDIIMHSLDTFLQQRVNTKGLLVKDVFKTETSTKYILKDIETGNLFVLNEPLSTSLYSIGDFLKLSDVILLNINDEYHLKLHDSSIIENYVLDFEERQSYLDYLTNEIISDILINNISLLNGIEINNQLYEINFTSSDETIVNNQGELINNGTVDLTISFLCGEEEFVFNKTVLVDLEVNKIMSPELLEDVIYVKGSLVHIEVMLNWNDASELVRLSYLEEDLILGVEYFVEEGMIIIDADYLQAIDIEHLDFCNFNLSFNQGDDLLIQVVFE